MSHHSARPSLPVQLSKATLRRVGLALAVCLAAPLLAGCGGGVEGSGSEAASAGADPLSSSTATSPSVVLGADGRPITGGVAAPKPAATREQRMAAYLRGFDGCALADEASAPPNTQPILITGGTPAGAELELSRRSVEAEHSNSLGSDLWVYRTAAEAESSLARLREAVADQSDVTVGRVERVLYATRGERVEDGLRACTEAGRAAEAQVASPGAVQRLTAAEEEFVRGPASELGNWCYQHSMRTGNPGSSPAGARRIARRLEALLAAKPDAQTSGGETVRQTAAEVVSGLEGWEACPVSPVGDELREALG